MPEFFIEALGLGRLVLKRLQIHRPRQRHRPAAGLIPLVAMQHDGIRLQQAGKKIGRDRHPARRDDNRPDGCGGNFFGLSFFFFLVFRRKEFFQPIFHRL